MKSASGPRILQAVIRKLRSARIRAAQHVAERRDALEAKQKARIFNEWLEHLTVEPPDVLVGSNFAEYGGVRHHIHAIARHSSLHVELAPPDHVLRSIQPHEIRTTFREQFLQFRPDGIKAVHSHVFPWFIEWCGLQSGITRWVHTYHLPYFKEHGRGELAPWQAEINRYLNEEARHADVRISVSRWQQAFLSENYGIDTVYIPNGVDVGMCDAAVAEHFTAAHGSGPFVLYVGRNDPVKDPAAFVKLATQMPAMQFVMLGRGLSTESIASDWNVVAPRNLKILGEVTHRQTLDALSACSAIVVTSKREGLPTLVLEAMALRKSIVVPDEAGCIEAIDHGRYGFVYRCGDTGDLVENTKNALGDTTRSADARDRVLTEYDWRVIARKLDAIYTG